MVYQSIAVTRSGPLLSLMVNRPKALNALTPDALRELRHALRGVRDNPPHGIRGIVLQGAGEGAFIAGADIKVQAQLSPEEGAALGALGQEVAGLLECVPVPTIACVDGYALGGGCEMALGCDLIFATEAARFGQPEVKLGLIPGFGGCVRLPRRVGPGVARDLIFTGRMVGGAEAQALGLIDRLFGTRAEMMAAARSMVDRIAKCSPAAVAIAKEALSAGSFEAELEGFRAVYATPDKAIGVGAFLAKEDADFSRAVVPSGRSISRGTRQEALGYSGAGASPDARASAAVPC